LAYRVYDRFKGDPAFTPWFDTFAPKGRAPEIGEIWSSPGHADTLAEIGETDGESLYRGRLAKKIVTFSNKFGGFLSAADLESYVPVWETPVSVNYRGYDIWEMPPNGQGIVALMALGILNGMKPRAKNSVIGCHRHIEAVKLAFAAGMALITDPAYMKIPVEELLSEDYFARLRSEITDRAQEPVPIQPKGSGTVYLAAADGDGGMVSFIQSNYMGFGSGMVVPGTGIALQNRGADFSLDPNHANALAGGKKSYHTIIPGFITRGGAPVGPFGVMGGYMQPQGHVQVLSNLIDHGMNPQAALDAPRWQWVKGKEIWVERHFKPGIYNGLARKGHDIQYITDSGSFGRGQIIQRDPATGVLAGGTESRTDGAVAAW
jgi:gamma-glutamyltranspeptidase/glutathione hydrolase